MAASQAVVPVLFTAKPDAPLGGTLASLTGKPADPKLNVPSRVQLDRGPRAGPEQRHRLVADGRQAAPSA